ncbi:phage tail protein I [Kaistia algarum]|uniref:phage tail protein I n=1 Tax=Kaistia algarum TaxID=2083279 RepID=UPI000CE877AA|nr:phage tail protein I [Kaistia algarum]MCX5512283.1 phage tail protein I [Kaistia algarum]PPE80374.1 phage tail protein I [Kaistia algarum]
MSAAGAILPTSAGPFERALADAMSDTLPVPIAAVFDPAQTPSAFIPWLAVHDGVRLWFSDWPEELKRLVIEDAPVLAGKVGLRTASVRMLFYVDGSLLDVVSYPTPFVQGRAVIGRTPIGHPAFVARHLVKVETAAPAGAFVMGRAAIGSARYRTPSREKIRRALIALATAKSPESEYRADFGHKRPLLLADAPSLDGSHHLGEFVARNKL